MGTLYFEGKKMSLRKKDDWDEALEESNNRTTPAFVPDDTYDYGVVMNIKLSDIVPDDTFSVPSLWPRTSPR